MRNGQRDSHVVSFTQRSYFCSAFVTGAIVVWILLLCTTPAGWNTLRQMPLPAWLVPLVGLGLAWEFSTLTITVSPTSVTWHFTSQLFRRSVLLDEIVGAEPVYAHWLRGIGVRWISNGWLYNIRPGEAVEIRMRNGRRYQLGCDDPARVATTILNGRKPLSR